MIGHTQPRRLAARTVAERIAEELGSAARWGRRLPGAVHRRGQRVDPGQGDDRRHPARRDRARPDAPRGTTRSSSTRPTSGASTSTSSSGTSRGCSPGGPTSRSSSRRPPSTRAVRPPLRRAPRVPVMEVSGRTYPVEVRYRPLVDRDRRGTAKQDRSARHLRGRRRAGRRGTGRHPRVPVRGTGDPRHRRRAAPPARRRSPAAEVLPLYARLSAAEQHRVFSRTPAGGSCWPPTSPRRR